MGVKERRQREKESLRQEILDAARELFAAEGYDNVSMRKIAEKIEYTPTTIYLYFQDKAELLYGICQEMFGELIQSYSKLGELEPDPVSALKRGLRIYIDFGLSHPNHYKVVFSGMNHNCDFEKRFPFEQSLGHEAFSYLVGIVQACIDQKAFRPVDVATASQTIWAALHGLVVLLIDHQDFPWVDREQLINHLIDTLVNGLKA